MMREDSLEKLSNTAEEFGPELSEQWQSLSTKLDISDALLALGELAEDRDPSYAYQWFRTACDCDDAASCMRLAFWLWDYECPRDYVEHDSWKERVEVYHKARELGHPHTGIDISPLIKHSFHEIKKRAERGDVWAKATVGQHLASTYPSDHELAYAWLAVALEDAEDADDRVWNEDRAMLWFIEQILDDEELARAKKQKETIAASFPRSMNLFWRIYYFFVRPL